ncbi:metal ABC transporter solute-binding protein, Zn/Mn family [Evansella clarkii]|uniref:metal ABC transporter solute-binding protein, Zn/Mn family n=1 Tax=Evansella clarkii TaxID=79879 RepID=UPI0009963A5B|nr:zinc ABC transporter substrate-binding protein [Evansella clarkii]
MKHPILLFTLLFTTFLLVACGGNEPETSADNNSSTIGSEENNAPENSQQTDEESIPLQVYTTLYPLEEFTSRIGGDLVNVVNIIPPNSDAHSFEPTANQMIDIAESDLFIINGAGFEGFAERIQETLENEKARMVTVSEGIQLIDADENDIHDDHGENNHNENDHNEDHHNEDNHANNEIAEDLHNEDKHIDGDPHIWIDPIRSIQIAENIKEELIDLMPEAEEEFTANFKSLKDDLESLDQQFKDMREEVTKDVFVVSHAAYGYWEDRYEIHQVAISGLSPSNEPSIKQIEEVINFVEENEINFIVFEQNIPANIAETVREQVGADALWLHNLESLTNEEIESGEDYFSLMKNNIKTLRIALQ